MGLLQYSHESKIFEKITHKIYLITRSLILKKGNFIKTIDFIIIQKYMKDKRLRLSRFNSIEIQVINNKGFTEIKIIILNILLIKQESFFKLNKFSCKNF